VGEGSRAAKSSMRASRCSREMVMRAWVSVSFIKDV